MDIISVINLGHTAKQPLIGLPSELSYRLEPHGLILQYVSAGVGTGGAVGRGGVYPGWCGQVGTRRGSIPGTQPGPRLRLI